MSHEKPVSTSQRSLGDITAVFIITVVTVAAALIWSDALKQLFTRYFPRDNLLAYFTTAIIVSIIAIVAIYYLSKNFKTVQLNGDDGLEDIAD